MDVQYYLDDYKNGVRKFIEDTKNWFSLDSKKFYLSSGNSMSEWEECNDKNNRGLDVSWAFKRENVTDLEIVKEFYKNIIEILNSDINNQIDYINCIDLDYKQ